jgi:hypothetical protein
MSSITTPTKEANVADRAAAGAATWVDERYRVAGGLRRQINKVFPTHWSFMLGEVALYSFIVLLLTGTYLTLFFDPSMMEVEYQGSYTPLRGVHMSRAFETALNLSFEVRGGLFARQLHHWAALLFMAAIVAHMLRVFFTGAFRKPREVNWVIGVLLFALGATEGFLGYSLPDDLLSGTGMRVISAVLLSVPVIGTWVHWALFGGEFPGELILPRAYIAHVLLIPGIRRAGLVSEAHPVPRGGPQGEQRRRCAYLADLRRQGRGVHRDRRRHLGDHGWNLPDQPDLGLRSVQPGTRARGHPTGLVHGVDRRSVAVVARLGGLPRRLHHPGRRGAVPVGSAAAGATRDGLSVDRAAVHQGHRAPQPAATPA